MTQPLDRKNAVSKTKEEVLGDKMRSKAHGDLSRKVSEHPHHLQTGNCILNLSALLLSKTWKITPKFDPFYIFSFPVLNELKIEDK